MNKHNQPANENATLSWEPNDINSTIKTTGKQHSEKRNGLLRNSLTYSTFKTNWMVNDGHW